jgi:hypothetical protein
MLILDSPAQERWDRAKAIERTQQQRQQALEHEIFSNTISVRDDAGRDTSNLLAQMGRPLTSAEVQRRLHLCNPKLIFEQSIRHPELVGVYIEKDERTAAGGWTKRKVHQFGMESGIMPEFSVRHQTTKRVPNPEVIAGGGKQISREAVKWLEVPTFYAETRGWRTVLLRALHRGLITRGDAEKYFDWTPSQDSELWAAETR